MTLRLLLIMSLVLAALVAWDRALVSRGSQQRQASARVGQPFGAEALADRSVAAIRVDIGDANHLYVHQDGLWRCASAHGAPAENERIEAIIPALIEAVGVVRTRDPEKAADFGLDGERALRVSVCGSDVFTDPTGDVVFAADIGNAIAATDGSFIRPVGGDAIWAVDTNVRSVIGEEAERRGLPPMLDPNIIPKAWPGVQAGPSRIVIDIRGSETITITRHEETDTSSQAAYRWHVGSGDEQFVGDLFQVTSFAVFLLRAPYSGILAPRPPESVGLDPPAARIEIETTSGDRLQLAIGAAGPQGGVVVYNTFTQLLYEVPGDLVRIMLPELDMFLDAQRGNPWEPWLRR